MGYEAWPSAASGPWDPPSGMTKIDCDGCGADCGWSGNSVDYRLDLKSVSIPGPGGSCAATDMMIWPEIGRDHHFCGLRCLRKWLTAERSE